MGETVKNYRLTIEVDIGVEVEDENAEYLDYNVLETASSALYTEVTDEYNSVDGVRIVAISDPDIIQIDRMEDVEA